MWSEVTRVAQNRAIERSRQTRGIAVALSPAHHIWDSTPRVLGIPLGRSPRGGSRQAPLMGQDQRGGEPPSPSHHSSARR